MTLLQFLSKIDEWANYASSEEDPGDEFGAYIDGKNDGLREAARFVQDFFNSYEESS